MLGTSRRTALIFVYHRVADSPIDPWALCVSPERFIEQLTMLRRTADLVPLDVIVNARSDRDLPQRPIALTFDDGYADVLTHAKPILEAIHIPATVFVTSGYINLSEEIWSDKLGRLIFLSDEDPAYLARRLHLYPPRYLKSLHTRQNWHAWKPASTLSQWLYCTLHTNLLCASEDSRAETLDAVQHWAGQKPSDTPPAKFLTSSELLTLARSHVIEIGAHTVTHPVLSNLDPVRQHHEIVSSKRELEILTGTPVNHFSYPYGKKNHFTAATIRAVQFSGFNSGCANYGRLITNKTNRWALPRYQMLNWGAAELAKEIAQWS